LVHLRPTKLPLPLTLSPAPRLRSAACSPCALLLRRALLRRHIPYITFENTSIKQPVFALPLLSSYRQVYVYRLAVRLSKPVSLNAKTDPASCNLQRRSRGLLHPSQVRRTTNATKRHPGPRPSFVQLCRIFIWTTHVFSLQLLCAMLHRVPQLPLPSADARYASLTGTTIPAPFPLVCAATVDTFSQASCSHPLSAPCDTPSTAPAPRCLQSIKHLMRPPVE
jgi:hypothetical protein